MNRFKELLVSEPYILLDGAMGTLLMAAGLQDGAPPEEWNVLHPERVQAVHRQYIEAGSRVILTNSFGGTRYRLKLHNLQDRVHELNRAAAVNARAAADDAPVLVAVAGSMGPTGQLLAPMGEMTFEEARAAFAEQAAGLVEGGVDVLWVETMSDVNEVRAAVEGARSVTDLPVVASMSFDTRGHTMMGVSPVDALEQIEQLGVVALGSNCGSSPAENHAAVKAMHATGPEVTLLAKPNAGIPRWEDEGLVYDGTPEVMARYAIRLRRAGARLIGACCGSTPEHIKAMATALKDPSQFTLPDNEQGASVDEPLAKNGRQRKKRRRRSLSGQEGL